MSNHFLIVAAFVACMVIFVFPLFLLGTVVPTFISIPAAGTSITFLIFAGILLALSVVYFVGSHTGKKKIIVSAVVFVLCCALGYSDSFAFWENDLTYEGESIYNYLQVSETDKRVVLSTNVLFGVQSVYMKEGGDYIMTDDKAPLELLGMQVIDQVIKEEVAYYKGIYEEQGLDGLLQSL